VPLAGSVGGIVANDGGTWGWTFDTADGPEESQTVTLTVDNVAPWWMCRAYQRRARPAPDLHRHFQRPRLTSP